MEKEKKFKGSLTLDWINKDKSLYYEIDESQGRGIKPQWVDKNDIRVSEPRILNFVKSYGDETSENMLIRGDNLLVLRTLVEQFKSRDEKDKVKCIYIDPPYNTGNAFDKYDDNLKHSEWLTMMRDRLMLLKKLMRKDGAIFVQIDYEEFAHLKLVMDEIFGRKNLIIPIVLKRSAPTGHKVINPTPVNVTDFLLVYALDRSYWDYKPVFVKRDFDFAYDRLIENFEDGYSNWKFISLKEFVAKKLGFQSSREAKKELGAEFGVQLEKFAIDNGHRVFRFSAINYEAVSKDLQKLFNESKKYPDKIFFLPREEHSDFYLKDQNRITFYSTKVKEINGQKVTAEALSNIWEDIAWQGIAKEGGVVFQKNKKPERLIQRIIEMSTGPGELVLDSFAGSGTTAAVAHKMGRKWITIELGRHAEDLCMKRLGEVAEGKDDSGVSKEVNWTGGGGFKYYKLGESLISEKDVNWNLTYEQIAEALFYAKNFKLVEDGGLNKKKIFLGENRNEKGVYAVCSVSKDIEFIKLKEYLELVEKVSKMPHFKELNVYTNKAINVRKEEQAESVFIRKIPQTILKKYNLL